MDRIVLHYYPGHFPCDYIDNKTGTKFGPGLLVALKGNTVLFRCPAWGGPQTATVDDAGRPVTPTPAGTYVLRKPEPHTTKAWKLARIRWGTKIKLHPMDPTDFEFEQRPGVWLSARGAHGIQLSEVMAQQWELYRSKEFPPTWVFNPFGPLAVRFFKDKNNNRMLDKDEHLQGEMFHTTPLVHSAREGEVLNPGNSHGCVHMQIEDRDRLIGFGVLKAGVTLIIHQYSEHYGVGA